MYMLPECGENMKAEHIGSVCNWVMGVVVAESKRTLKYYHA